MRNHLLYELWEIRFQKLYKAEKESFLFYRKLLEKNKAILEGSKAKDMLEKIMREEIRHFRIAHQLLQLVKQKNRQKKSRDKNTSSK